MLASGPSIIHSKSDTAAQLTSLCESDIGHPTLGPACLITCSLYQSHTGSESSSNSRKEMLPKPITIVTSESSTCFVRSAAEEFGYGEGHAITSQTPGQVFHLFYLSITLFRVNMDNKKTDTDNIADISVSQLVLTH